jgi:hypothetical protein
MLRRKITAAEADEHFRAAGLIPLTEYARQADEREAICTRCGTWRRVTLRALRSPDGIACRWCDGWAKWVPWGNEYREQVRGWRPIRGKEFSARQIAVTGLMPLTPLGDEFTPVGCLCLKCGETLVTVPERIDERRPDWFSCARCQIAANRAASQESEKVFADAGLKLLGKVLGRHTPMPVECLTCGILRHVTYNDALNGTGPACWTCTHGIRPDEPHRLYLFRFPALGVLKVGITHARHDNRLMEHRVNGGELVQVVTVPDRDTALAAEAWILASRRQLLRTAVGPLDFPQGGWTEAWSEVDAPALDLEEVCRMLTQTHEQRP